ncbi:universal stress protein [Desulfoferrobacter suflitae]|uniref:universal stress protein n=1 Tax=Desulfoferrobacter suflitae TaxID=2865782 RepID=UPI0021640D2E|nr:universal stress protein [Desulfoferrobacter suflitae]MCK8601867.1 universal stress protein [Desulfoferrobacter suflitae]
MSDGNHWQNVQGEQYLIPKGVAEITVVHALETLYLSPLAVLEQPEDAGRSEIQAVVKDLRNAGALQVHGIISKGHPVSKIMECLATGDYSLVVMGTQGKSLLAEILPGSVACNIARLTPCPVILIPRRA